MRTGRRLRPLLAIGIAVASALPGCTERSEPSHSGEKDPGKKHFDAYCAACHGPEGTGTELRIPPLLGSTWVTGPDARLIRIVLHGVRGAIRVGDKSFNLEMPSFGAVLGDPQIAAVLSYIRRQYGGLDSPVDAATVGRIRAETASRSVYWTPEELLEVR